MLLVDAQIQRNRLGYVLQVCNQENAAVGSRTHSHLPTPKVLKQDALPSASSMACGLMIWKKIQGMHVFVLVCANVYVHMCEYTSARVVVACKDRFLRWIHANSMLILRSHEPQ